MDVDIVICIVDSICIVDLYESRPVYAFDRAFILQQQVKYRLKNSYAQFEGMSLLFESISMNIQWYIVKFAESNWRWSIDEYSNIIFWSFEPNYRIFEYFGFKIDWAFGICESRR